MPLARLSFFALLACALTAFAQDTQEQRANSSAQSGFEFRSPAVQSTTPWKILPKPGGNLNSAPVLERADSLKNGDRTFDISGNIIPYPLFPGDRFPSQKEASEESLCYNIRSYVVARDDKDSDTTHPIGSSTCQPARRYALKNTDETDRVVLK